MKIKKLTIHGFKSFVDKVTLNFHSGTSGIIGPNGCGKSNIVDAIRWVLGEQNARHLRGKHMEDIIFTGTESRKPLGMAEVVLTFSNEHGLAPAAFANFTEIEISRRLYRSGESEYYINRVQSRLRDIVDLFTDTGIGTRAYSIIEQGQVGWLINAKPEERRAIFEEAAGINKFKHKKDAALRRLESTRENLTRVSDIIGEVKRQLNSLNRQAKKAERYKAMRDELKEVELLLSSVELARIKTDLASVGKRLESVKDEELSLGTLAIAKEEQAEELKVEHLGAEAAHKGVREKSFGLERRIQDEESSSALASMRSQEIKRTEERLGSEIAELEAARSALSTEIEALSRAAAELSSEIEGESAQLAGSASALDALTSELRGKEEAQSGLKADSLRISSRLADIRHAIQDCLRDEEGLRAAQARAGTETASVSASLASLEGPLMELRRRIGSARSEREAVEAGIGAIRQRLEGLEAERASKSDEALRARDEYAKASALLATLEEMEKDFGSLEGGARAIMRREGASGVRGLIADCMEANPGFEKAVEAALADKLQYVLVDSAREGVEAIEYLRAQGAGRGSFVPAGDVRPASPVPVQAGPMGGARALASQIRIKEGCESIVGCLLGEVYLADDLASALAAWKESEGLRSFVTPEGEMIDAQGIITGGSALSDSGILQRRGEIKRLRASAEGLQAGISSIEDALRAIDEAMQSTKAALESERDRLHRADLEQVNLSGALKRDEGEVERLNKTLESLAVEKARAQERGAQISAKKGTLSGEREALEAAMAEKDEAIAALAAGMSALASRKEELSSVVTEARVRLASSSERVESLKRGKAEKERALEESGRRIEARKEAVNSGRAELAEKERQAAEIKARLEALLIEKDSVKREESEKAEALEAIAGQIRTAEQELKQMKSKYSELAELKGELTIETRELEMAAANLCERMLEKYAAKLEEFRPAEGEDAPHAPGLETHRDELREKISSLGEVSLSALEEYNELDSRHQFLLDQQSDLTQAVESLHTAIQRINRTTREKFKVAFEQINAKFQETFPRLFHGGRAELRLTEDADVLDAGVEIVAQPPGKRLQNITLLSGGEKALTATALIFAIFLIKPSPFCLLDEVDAPLDDANIDRFNLFVREMAERSQFLLITHNKKTMEMADALYGITMQEQGVSNVLSLRL